MPRRAAPADLDALLPLVRAFCAADGHEFDSERVVAALGPLLRDDSLGRVWVIDDGAGGLSGYAVLTWGWSLESGGREALLDEIFVLEQGRGSGSDLLDHVLQGARAGGAAAVFLETESPNHRVRSFYARHGFGVEDSVWMRRDLRP